MKKLGRIAVPVLGAGALVMASATAALASATITSNGVAYSGDVRATNLGNATISGVSTLGAIITTCTGAQLDAYINSNGTGGVLNGVSTSGCTNNKGGTTTITALNLPYSGGTVNHAPVAGGRDATLTIPPNAPSHVQAVLTLPALGIPSLTCHYTLTTTLTLDLYNHNNANKPVAGNAQAQGKLNGQSLQRRTSPAPDPRCPSSVSANGNFQIVPVPTAGLLAVGP